ncbi:uncharacterized protein B0I36DRAFT_347761 [Microdochium trichocladiopsis]|uniref:Uncharacterized protein n=1 Tax=Microdochium trichocladiopsis TaxID=1682393 RepID=A0A9P8Y7G1_9PEZI|nr:uncharacterized protein B0I36DRAFT_347761 [Microdochium trichocladiopsis]KAH7032569.1 hypothetical protein B0I36DRAFT_347761 [Microdochium trichocladiopsis]
MPGLAAFAKNRTIPATLDTSIAYPYSAIGTLVSSNGKSFRAGTLVGRRLVLTASGCLASAIVGFYPFAEEALGNECNPYQVSTNYPSVDEVYFYGQELIEALQSDSKPVSAFPEARVSMSTGHPGLAGSDTGLDKCDAQAFACLLLYLTRKDEDLSQNAGAARSHMSSTDTDPIMPHATRCFGMTGGATVEAKAGARPKR